MAEERGDVEDIARLAIHVRSHSPHLRLELLPFVGLLREEDALVAISGAYVKHPLHFSRSAVASGVVAPLLGISPFEVRVSGVWVHVCFGCLAGFFSSPDRL